MKTEHSEKIVRVKGIPKLTEEQREELLKLAAMPDATLTIRISRKLPTSRF